MSNLNVNVGAKIGVKKGLKKKMSITIDADTLEEFNAIAKANRYNKSLTITNLIKMFIKSEKKSLNKLK